MEQYSSLVLTQAFTPHCIYPWYDTVSALFNRKVTVVEEYDEVVSSPSVTLKIPAVVVLRKSFNLNKDGVRYSRSAVYQRDGFACQYCGQVKEARRLTLDHVIPRVQGGTSCWTNCTTCCRTCNHIKGGRTPAQAGMKLLSKPVKPKSLPMGNVFVLPRQVPSLWIPYLEGFRTMQMVG